MSLTYVRACMCVCVFVCSCVCACVCVLQGYKENRTERTAMSEGGALVIDDSLKTYTGKESSYRKNSSAKVRLSRKCVRVCSKETDRIQYERQCVCVCACVCVSVCVCVCACYKEGDRTEQNGMCVCVCVCVRVTRRQTEQNGICVRVLQ